MVEPSSNNRINKIFRQIKDSFNNDLQNFNNSLQESVKTLDSISKSGLIENPSVEELKSQQQQNSQ